MQTRAIQRLLSLATKAERVIEANRRLVSASTEVALHANNVALYGQVAADKVMTNTLDGSTSTASSITAATGRIPTFAYQAERTIAANPSGTTLDGDFVWEPGNCFGCNAKYHKWRDGDDFICPHHNVPEVEVAARNSLAALCALRLCRKSGHRNDVGHYGPSSHDSSSVGSSQSRKKKKSSGFSYDDLNKTERAAFVQSLMTNSATREKLQADVAALASQLPGNSLPRPPPLPLKEGRAEPHIP